MKGGHKPPESRSGPLSGIRVIEIANLAPVPFACMLLADLGADVLRVERPAGAVAVSNPLGRNKRVVELDLKVPGNVEGLLELVQVADVMVEGFRPGVAERLGIGPEVCLKINSRLIYGRLTGWGQDGPLAQVPGHDINFIAVAGVLHGIGAAGQKPVPPVNFLGDFAGGGLLVALGIASALVERAASGEGQVVDAAMVEGAALLTATLHGMLYDGRWSEERGVNSIDGGAPFYSTYGTADDRFVAVGAMEPQFYEALLRGLDLDREYLPAQWDRAGWPYLHEVFSRAFCRRPLAEWIQIFADRDACVSPVLTPSEVADFPHFAARSGFVEVGGAAQPGPAPRFSRSRLDDPFEAQRFDRIDDVLELWGSPRT